MSKFLSTGSSGTITQLQDGTSYINVAVATINGLAPNLPVKSGADRSLTSSLLSASDLDFAPLSNPFVGTLQVSGDVEANYNTTTISLVETNMLAADALPKAGGAMSGTLNAPTIVLGGVDLDTRLDTDENNIFTTLTRTQNLTASAGINTLAGSLDVGAIDCASLSTAGDVSAGTYNSLLTLASNSTLNANLINSGYFLQTNELYTNAILPTFGTINLNGVTTTNGAALTCGALTASSGRVTNLSTAGYVKNNASGNLSTAAAIPQADVTNLETRLTADENNISTTLNRTQNMTASPLLTAFTDTLNASVFGCNSADITGTLTNSSLGAGYVKADAVGLFSSQAAIPQADVTNLVSDLAAKAPVNNPIFTGVVNAGTVACNTCSATTGNFTQMNSTNIQIGSVLPNNITSTLSLNLVPSVNQNLNLVASGTGAINLTSANTQIVINPGSSSVSIPAQLYTGGPRGIITLNGIGQSLTVTAGALPRSMPLNVNQFSMAGFTCDNTTGLLTYTGALSAACLVSINWSANFNVNGTNAAFVSFHPTSSTIATGTVSFNGLNATTGRMGGGCSFPIIMSPGFTTLQLHMSINQTTETLSFLSYQMIIMPMFG